MRLLASSLLAFFMTTSLAFAGGTTETYTVTDEDGNITEVSEHYGRNGNLKSVSSATFGADGSIIFTSTNGRGNVSTNVIPAKDSTSGSDFELDLIGYILIMDKVFNTIYDTGFWDDQFGIADINTAEKSWLEGLANSLSTILITPAYADDPPDLDIDLKAEMKIKKNGTAIVKLTLSLGGEKVATATSRIKTQSDGSIQIDTKVR